MFVKTVEGKQVFNVIHFERKSSLFEVQLDVWDVFFIFFMCHVNNYAKQVAT